MKNNELIKKAEALAKKAHAGQKYGDKDYFEYHVKGVAALAKEYGGKYTLIEVVALLHDVVEDSDISMGHIEADFGEEVAKAVGFLTHLTDKTYTQYICDMVKFGNKLALSVKLCDLQFNAEHSSGARRDKYQLAMTLIAGGLI